MSIRAWCWVCLGVLVSGVQAAPPLSVDDAFKPPLISNLKISPDGRTLLAVAYAGGHSAAAMIDVETLKTTYVKGLAPTRARWLPDGTAVIASVPDSTAVVRPNGEVVDRVEGMLVRLLAPAADGAPRILVRRWRNEDAFVVVNLRTHDRALANQRLPSGDVEQRIFDDQGVVRVLTMRDSALWRDDTRLTHWYRATDSSPWEKLATFDVLEDGWVPQLITDDGKALLVYSRLGRDTYAYFRYELTERRLGAVVAEHPRYDVAAAAFGAGEALQFLAGDGMRPDLLWSRPEWVELQRLVDEALPGRVNRLEGDPLGLVLVHSHADVDPGRWLLLDVKRKQLRDLFEVQPEIDASHMLPKRIVSYRSVDGLEIPAYLTLPAVGSGPRKAVVLVHGGPVWRDRWDWDAEVQLLASRGYAVLQPQFRGSSGFGRRFMEAGRGQWGQAMQDDLSAGARWLIEQGHADADRLCIVGASYGGYAALWALAKTPQLFRCGVSFAGVSDLELRMKDDSDTSESKVGRLWQRDFIGDLEHQRQQLAEVSPLRHADRIVAPLLIAHGDADRRVPIKHSEAMVEALRKAGKTFEWLRFEGEGHGLTSSVSQHRYYEAVFDFLARHIGDRAGGVAVSSESRASMSD